MNQERDGEGRPGYSPISDYAIIGDCRTAALVSRTGSIDWLCPATFTSPALFAGVLDDRRGGHFAIRPVGDATVSRRYRDDSPVLESSFETSCGCVHVTDLMSVPPSGELRPDREVLRIVEGMAGEVRLDIRFAPRPDFGRAKVHLRPRGAGIWSCEHEGRLTLLHSDVPLTLDPAGGTLRGEISLAAGDRRYLALAYADRRIGILPGLGPAAERRLAATLEWWQGWSGGCRYRGPYRREVLRSALALKLLTHAPSGAVLAAPTTSLPEKIGGEANWDYRFCWLRDAAFTLRAFVGLGYDAEAAAFMGWLLNVTRLSKPRLQVLYGPFGRTDLPERELDHLDGYRGSRPVRVGNAADKQFQLDVYGEVLLAASDFVAHGGRLERSEAKLLGRLGQTICQLWRTPDNGIWEFRGERRHYTYSKLMCWVGLDRLLGLARDGHVTVQEEPLRREREAIRKEIETHGFDPALDSYLAVLDGRDIDASLLLMSVHGYHPPDHPRVQGTVDRIRRVLGRHGLLCRYGDAEQGPSPGESAFGICNFWLVDHLCRLGQVREATECFENLLSLANDVGLFAEEIEPGSREARGNFPQAFTHVGLINAALAIAKADGSAAA